MTRRHVQQGLGKNDAQQSVVTEDGTKLKTCWSDSPSTSVILKLRYAYHRWHQSGSVLDFFFSFQISILTFTDRLFANIRFMFLAQGNMGM